MSQKKDKQKTFAFVSLGCPKNLVDSERMLGKLAQEGYVLCPTPKARTLSSLIPAVSSSPPGKNRLA
jgi:2-methylthioadenine synthetase